MEEKQEEDMVSLNGIIEQVAEFYGIDAEDLLYGDRRQAFSEPRHVAMYLCHRLLGMSKTAIGANFGKNRTLVLYAINKIADCVADPRYNRRAAECVEIIMWNNSKEK